MVPMLRICGPATLAADSPSMGMHSRMMGDSSRSVKPVSYTHLPAHYLNLRDGGFLAGNRAFVLDAEVAAFAQPGQRAAFALGLFAAYERAQFHEPLIEVPGLASRDEGLRQLADAALGGLFLYGRVDVENAGQDALHIAVQDVYKRQG